MKKLIILTVVYMMLSLASFAQNHKRPDSYNYNRAVEAIQNNNVEEALDYLKKELSDAPKNGYAYSWLAYVRENQGEYGMALSAADKAIKNIPSKDSEYVIFALSVRARTYHARPLINKRENELAVHGLTLGMDVKSLLEGVD
jgi:tetratricopeptide (TPR) repeat protein